MKKYTIEEIQLLIKERLSIIKKGKSQTDPQVDEISEDITNSLIEYFDDYEVDFILETLTHFGDAPNLIYDDNGLFAVTCDGYQPVVTGNQKIEGEFIVFVEKKQWKKTIREALKYYLTH